jgi:2-methylcitrate dehydratase PrpD
MPTMPPRPITREIAAYAVHSRFDALPGHVQLEAARAFLNWIGCVFGGCHEPAVEIAAAAVADAGSHPQASLIGRTQRADVASAAFVNCMASSILAFDDTHLATVTHPSGPVAAGLFALCERQSFPGEELLNALALGIEIQCRLSNVLLMPPAKSNLGFFITGLTGPIGTAAALGRLLRFDEEKMRWAIGLAAAQASGFRSTHGAMAGAFVPAHAARTGVCAALLAAQGFTCTDHVLEGEKGFVDVFSVGADLDNAVGRLGTHFEMLANTYKPYPSGIVVHPIIDACLDIAAQLPPAARLGRVALEVNPLALSLTNRPKPRDPLEAQISLQHWAVVALLRRAAGLDEVRQACIDDPVVAELRTRIEVSTDPAIARDAAIATVTLSDGTSYRSHVANARGSLARPMTDAELDTKFRAQVTTCLTGQQADMLLRQCRDAARSGDIGRDVTAVWRS